MQGSAINPFTLSGDSDAQVPIFYATDYGATFDGSGWPAADTFDNTTAIQAALDDAAAFASATGYQGQHGAIVQLPAGTGRFTDTLTISNGVWLRGAGMGATILHGFDWAPVATSCIVFDNTNAAAKLSDLAIIQNTTTVCQDTAHSILVNSGVAWASALGGIVTEIERVLCDAAGGHGIVLDGVENRLRDVYVARVSKIGFWIKGSDHFLSNCTADTCTYEGFVVQSGNCKIVNCKAFGCNGPGDGVFNRSAIYNAGPRNMYANCEAQDNGCNGFEDDIGDSTYVGCIADTNGAAAVAGYQYGFRIAGGGTAVSSCVAINRTGNSQKYGYRLDGPANGVYNVVQACTSRLPGTAHVDPVSVGSINVNNLAGQQSVAYATPLTPDPYLGGSIIVGTLTGVLAVNPVDSAGLFSGMRVSFQFTQDGSGHAVTFDSQYKTAAAISTTASAVTRIEFEYDGTNFRETGRAVT